MSYCNSLFTACVNFITAKPDSPNYKLGIKILLYNFFNPGVGIILSCFSLFPSCDCSNNKFDKRGIVLSILGIFTGIIVMLCPISLCIGTYLIKLTDKMITIFPIKITFIFIGAIGTFISFVLSAINKKTITEAIKIKINPLDMIIGYGENFSHLISTFGWASFFRILMNWIIPGSGTFTLLCKYGCSLCLILTSIIQFFGGVFFFISISILITGECNSEAYEKLFIKVLETTQEDLNDYTYFTTVFNYFYTMGLCFYLSGFF